MVTNTIVNIAIMICGALFFLGIAGGLICLSWVVERSYAYLCEMKKVPEVKRCSRCTNHGVCFGSFGGNPPENGCAYFNEKKP